jgi:hypothetical protein
MVRYKLAGRVAGAVVIGVPGVAPQPCWRQHVGGALNRAASGAERAPDDSTDGTRCCAAARGRVRRPRYRAGYPVPIPRPQDRLADSVDVGVARRTGVLLGDSGRFSGAKPSAANARGLYFRNDGGS